MSIDIAELERLAKAATPGPWEVDGTTEHNGRYTRQSLYLIVDGWQRGTLSNEFEEEKKDAAYIVAACNAVPELLKMYREADDEAADANSAWQKVRRENLALRERVQELERQRVELAELAIYGNGCFDCPLEDVCLYKEELVRDSAVCSRLLIEWVEKATKETGE